jgi:hypothetical protein
MYHRSCILLTSPQTGAYNEAVKGVDAIVHTASPVHLDAKDPKGKEASWIEERPRKIF